jgi:hypothetical protein
MTRIKRKTLKSIQQQIGIGNACQVQVGQQAELHHNGDHKIGRNGDIIACRAALELRQQFLIAAERVHDDLDARLPFEFLNEIGTDIIGPGKVIERRACLFGGGLASEKQATDKIKQAQFQKLTIQFCTLYVQFLIAPRRCSVAATATSAMETTTNTAESALISGETPDLIME